MTVRPAPLFDEWSWQPHGNCREYPLDLFFPDARGRRLLNKEAQAKSICRSCLVVATCRNYALRAHEAHGIWGALTPRERADLLTLDLSRRSIACHSRRSAPSRELPGEVESLDGLPRYLSDQLKVLVHGQDRETGQFGDGRDE